MLLTVTGISSSHVGLLGSCVTLPTFYKKKAGSLVGKKEKSGYKAAAYCKKNFRELFGLPKLKVRSTTHISRSPELVNYLFIYTTS